MNTTHINNPVIPYYCNYNSELSYNLELPIYSHPDKNAGTGPHIIGFSRAIKFQYFNENKYIPIYCPDGIIIKILSK